MSRLVSLVIGSLEGLAGGTEQHLGCLAQGLPERGWDVDVSSVLPTAFVAGGGAPFPVEVLAKGGTRNWRLQSVAALRRRWLDRRPGAAVAFFDNAQFAAQSAAAICQKIPVLAARRNLGVLRSGHSLLEIRMLDGGVSRFICNSEAVRRDVLSREGVPAGKTLVLYNGVDLSRVAGAGWRESRGIPGDALLVVCVASHRPVKGVDFFLRAFAEAVRAAPQARAVLVGDGPERPGLERLCRDLNIADRVLFEGANPDPRSIMAECQIGALGSRSEGFSTAVVEYMAAGLPSVLTDVGGNSEAVRDGREGFLVQSGDGGTFAVQLRRLFQDAPLREAMGRQARLRAVQLFDRKLMLDRMAQILFEVTQ